MGLLLIFTEILEPMRDKIHKFILAVLILVFLVSGSLFIREVSKENEINQDMESAREAIVVNTVQNHADPNREYSDSNSKDTQSGKPPNPHEFHKPYELYEPYEFSIDWNMLRSVNKDTVAWIRFDTPGMNYLNYPIVQSYNNEVYLTKPFDSSSAHNWGTVFMHYANDPNLEDRNTIIFGHRFTLSQPRQFSQFANYQNIDFYKENSYFYIYLPNGDIWKLDIFAVLKQRGDSWLAAYQNHISDDNFQNLIHEAIEGSFYNTGIIPSIENNIVTLYSCVESNSSYRYLIMATASEKVNE